MRTNMGTLRSAITLIVLYESLIDWINHFHPCLLLYIIPLTTFSSSTLVYEVYSLQRTSQIDTIAMRSLPANELV